MSPQLRKKVIKGQCVQKLFTWQAQALLSHSNWAKLFVPANNMKPKKRPASKWVQRREEGVTIWKSFGKRILKNWTHNTKNLFKSYKF